MNDLKAAKAALKKFFGYEEFRPMQTEIIQSVYQKKDTLVLMPTGGGKSICYQIPAITLPGTCIVISPLISLMKDQVEGLRANGIKAAYLNSSLSTSEWKDTFRNLMQGHLELLYISPEKISAPNFMPVLKDANINLIAVDEAHCISAWGHDFRPEYAQLGFLKKNFPHIPIIALTATADKLTRKDIVDQLKMEQANTFIASFDRPNLSLKVRPGQKRFEQILSFLQKRPDQSGIIYCLSRKSTESLANKLKNNGFNAEAYHAGLPPKQRSKVQEDFIKDNTPIVCATIAFGMGIDKSNVRWVIHYNLPKNLEGYYQEIGRAGRDGVAADTMLFYSFQDIMVLRDLMSNNSGENEEIQLAKLDRMRQYAEAAACRRKILLSYFGEELEENCGNCDVCDNPPEAFDGTIIAQKALSAVSRLQQKVAMGTLIDVLRGSSKKEIINKNYHKIKTFAAGRDVPYSHWQQYLLQLLNLGYIEIAYHQQNQVLLTPLSKSVLFEGKKIALVKPATLRKRQEEGKKEAQKVTKKGLLKDELFQILRQVRKRVSQEFGLPPYRIFSDATLLEMVEKKPNSSHQLLQISGVGEQKLDSFGDAFLDAIIEFVREKDIKVKGATYQKTLALLQAGESPEAIAKARELSPTTIYSHIAYLYEREYPVDISPFVKSEEIKVILKAFQYVEKPIKLKDVYDYFDGKYSYPKIRLAQAYLNRAQK